MIELKIKWKSQETNSPLLYWYSHQPSTLNKKIIKDAFNDRIKN